MDTQIFNKIGPERGWWVG